MSGAVNNCPLTSINHCVIYIALVQKLILAKRSRMNYLPVGPRLGDVMTRVGVRHVASDVSQIRTFDVGCRSRSSLCLYASFSNRVTVR